MRSVGEQTSASARAGRGSSGGGADEAQTHAAAQRGHELHGEHAHHVPIAVHESAAHGAPALAIQKQLLEVLCDVESLHQVQLVQPLATTIVIVIAVATIIVDGFRSTIRIVTVHGIGRRQSRPSL
jgi:hypothetical protein